MIPLYSVPIFASVSLLRAIFDDKAIDSNKYECLILNLITFTSRAKKILRVIFAASFFTFMFLATLSPFLTAIKADPNLIPSKVKLDHTVFETSSHLQLTHTYSPLPMYSNIIQSILLLFVSYIYMILLFDLMLTFKSTRLPREERT